MPTKRGDSASRKPNGVKLIHLLQDLATRIFSENQRLTPPTWSVQLLFLRAFPLFDFFSSDMSLQSVPFAIQVISPVRLASEAVQTWVVTVDGD